MSWRSSFWAFQEMHPAFPVVRTQFPPDPKFRNFPHVFTRKNFRPPRPTCKCSLERACKMLIVCSGRPLCIVVQPSGTGTSVGRTGNENGCGKKWIARADSSLFILFGEQQVRNYLRARLFPGVVEESLVLPQVF